jgi:hypothetical protein
MTSIVNAARKALSKGISVIPMADDCKTPLIKWKPYTEKAMDPSEWRWVSNLAILTGAINRIVVVDCDTYEGYTGWLKHRPATPLRVRTRRGIHFFYRHPGTYIKLDAHIQAPEGFSYDVRGDNSYVVAPPSIVKGHQYQFCICSGNLRGKWIDPDQLPVFDPAWRPDRLGTTGAWEQKPIRDIVAYINRLHAVEGQGGDKETYKAVRLVQESGASESEAVAILAEWNQTNCTPPWGMRDLYRKVAMIYSGAQSA